MARILNDILFVIILFYLFILSIILFIILAIYYLGNYEKKKQYESGKDTYLSL